MTIDASILAIIVGFALAFLIGISVGVIANALEDRSRAEMYRQLRADLRALAAHAEARGIPVPDSLKSASA